MKTNYLSNNNNETINAIADAINFEKYDMLLSLNADAQKKQTSIISSDTATADDVEIAQKKLKKLQDEATEFIEKQNTASANHSLVLTKVSSASNEFASNDTNAVRNILRLSACDENSKFFKLAIITENIKFESFYDAMVALHDMDSNEISNNGLRTYSKEAKLQADNLEKDIQGLIKAMFSIQIENDFTRKINVKFNKTDMNVLHETFVTGLTVDMSKSKKNGVNVEGLSYRYAIRKVTKQDGKPEYEGSRFKEILAKIAFAKLFATK